MEDDFEVCWNCCAIRPGVSADDENADDGDNDSGETENEDVQTLSQELAEYQSVWKPYIAPMMGVVSRLPCAVIALLIQLPLWFLPTETAHISWDYSPGAIAFAVFGVSLFIPRPIQQQDWKRLPVLAVFGAMAPFMVHWGMVSLLPPDTLSIHRVTWPLALILLVGAVEWLRSANDSWLALLLVTVAGVTVAFVYGMVSFFLEAYPPLTISRYLNSALFLALTWISVPLGFWLAERPRVACRAVTGLGLATAVGCYVWTFSVGVYWIANDSIAGGGPLFSQEYSARLLAFRGKNQDFEFLLAQLNEANWSREFRLPQHTIEFKRDWRHTAVSALIRHDEAKAAENLSKILLRQPSRQLLDMTEGLFIRQRRYETAPIYLRYAEEESMHVSGFALVGADRYKLALDELNVPHVAHAWIRDSLFEQVFFAALKAQREAREPELKDEELTIHSSLRKKLSNWLGKDAGEFYLDWVDLYDAEIQSVATPLGNVERLECDRVVECFNDYDAVLQRLGVARETAKENGWKSPVAPDLPNWDVPTTTELQREIDAFSERVDKAIELTHPL